MPATGVDLLVDATLLLHRELYLGVTMEVELRVKLRSCVHGARTTPTSSKTRKSKTCGI